MPVPYRRRPSVKILWAMIPVWVPFVIVVFVIVQHYRTLMPPTSIGTIQLPSTQHAASPGPTERRFERDGVMYQAIIMAIRAQTAYDEHADLIAIKDAKAALALMDSALDTASTALMRAQIALMIVRSAKAIGDAKTEAAYTSCAHSATQTVLSSPNATAADKNIADQINAALEPGSLSNS